MTTKFFTFTIACFWLLFTQSQTLNFVNYSSLEGLPSSEVYDLYQDEGGYLWFATDRGLSRYDGYEFRNYSLEDELTSMAIFEFFPQKDGRVWCSTYNNRVFYFYPQDEKFVPYEFNDSLQKYAREDLCDKIYIDPDGTLYISFAFVCGTIAIDADGNVLDKSDRGCSRKDGYILVEKTPTIDYFTYMQSEGSSRIWNQSQSIANKFDYDIPNEYQSECFEDYTVLMVNDSLKLFKYGVYQVGVKGPSIKCVRVGFLDKYVWSSYFGGGVRFYDYNLDQKYHFLKGKTVTACLSDHEGGYWFSTLSSGVYYTRSLELHHYQLSEEEQVPSLCISKQGGVIANTLDGSTYSIVNDRISLIASSFKNDPSFSETYAYPSGLKTFILRDNILEGDIGKLFFGINDYISGFNDDNEDRCILFSKLFLRIIDEEGEVNLFPMNLKFINDACFANDDVVYLGMREGLFSYNLKEKIIRPHSNKNLKHWITEIDRISRDHFIAGTKEKGVMLIQGEHVINITTKQGLLSNIINEVYVENKSNYWVCTNKGLNRIEKTSQGNYHVDFWDTNDGLSTNELLDIEIQNGVVWLATKKGVDKVPLSYLNSIKLRKKDAELFLKLNSAKVNGNKRVLSNLSYDQNEISFKYSAISFASNKKLQYRYRLKGLNNKWIITKNREITFESLPSGDYYFELQAGINGEWFEEVIKEYISISPPYYATWYFRTAVGLFIVLTIYLFFRFRVLSYNRYIIQEILRQLQKRLRVKDNSFLIEVNKEQIKINSNHILYVSAHKNYFEIHRKSKSVVVRGKISEFVQLVPDPQEYLQINRSTVIRKDKVQKKSKKSVFINNLELKIGITYNDVYDQLYL